MIKVNCKDGIELVKEEYPCLKITQDGRIVLFVEARKGYQLVKGRCSGSMFMHYSNGWLESQFELYLGTIELSNEL